MRASDHFPSWGFYPKVQQKGYEVLRREKPFPVHILSTDQFLPRGLGRSYGDVCLNGAHTLLLSHRLDKFLSFDAQTGTLTCESGVTLNEIISVFLPRGWFLPVTPGTKFVTVGGAIANDVHGKNHHQAGNFSRAVVSFDLRRSTGETLTCSRIQNSDYFFATIGGLGLTGFISQVTLNLKSVSSPQIDQEVLRFHTLEDFFILSQESEGFEYTVSWVDCFAAKGRGLFIRGNHEQSPSSQTSNKRSLNIPFFAPKFLLNPLSMKIFNHLYFRKQWGNKTSSTTSVDSFFYPLDGILNWNRLYGRRGFLQYQCVVPYEARRSPIQDILKRIAKSSRGSFLAVLKIFGDIPSEGMLSFPRKGVTLALDFAFEEDLLRLLDELDQITFSNGGALYPAKDSRMSPWAFAKSFPQLSQFLKFKDPQLSSSFWRRVT